MSTTARLGIADSILSNIQLGKGSVFHPDNDGRSPYGPSIGKPSIYALGLFRADPFVQLAPAGSTSSTFSANVTAGSTLVLTTGGFGGDAQPSSVADNLGTGNVWTKLIGVTQGNGPCTIWATFNIPSGGACTVTATGMGTLGPSCAAWEVALGPTARVVATASGNTGTPHVVTTNGGLVTSTGFYGVCFTAGSANIGGGYSRGSQFQHSVNPTGRFFQMGFGADFFSTNGAWTSGAGTANTVAAMLTDIEGATALSVSGAATMSVTGLELFEGGRLKLEDNGRLLLEDGSFLLTEFNQAGDTPGRGANNGKGKTGKGDASKGVGAFGPDLSVTWSSFNTFSGN
jgi:hypothetical protein